MPFIAALENPCATGVVDRFADRPVWSRGVGQG
jgi:hypothetical protein